MNISRDNYEQLAMEYIEGTLSDSKSRDFEAFLANNDDIAESINSLIEFTPSLVREHITYPDKAKLYRRATISLRRIAGIMSGAVAASVIVGLVIVSNEMTSKVEDAVETAIIEPSATVNQSELIEPIHANTSTIIAEDIPAKTTSTKKAKRQKSLPSPKVEEVTKMATNQPLTQAKEEPIPCVPEIETTRIIPTVDGNFDLAKSTTQVAILDKDEVVTPRQEATSLETDHSPFKHRQMRLGKVLRRSFATIIAPIDHLSPIRRYQTENSRGIEIASIRIEKNFKP